MIKLRVSILNGCAFCVRYHLGRLRQMGETELRIDLISAWKEAPCYSQAERLAFQYADELTLISAHQHIADDFYQSLSRAFGEKELASLTLSIALINVWNRLAIPFQTDLSSIEPLLAHSKAADLAFANRNA